MPNGDPEYDLGLKKEKIKRREKKLWTINFLSKAFFFGLDRLQSKPQITPSLSITSTALCTLTLRFLVGYPTRDDKTGHQA